jgi:hypothetical protein
MRTLREWIATLLGAAMCMVAMVVAVYALPVSIGIGSDNTNCSDSNYACFGRAELVLIASGLALLSLLAAGLLGAAGVGLFKYGAAEPRRWRWRILLAAVGGALLTFGWLVAALYYWASTGAFD